MRIFFVHQGSRSFFDRDREILAGIAEVRSLDNYPPSWRKLGAIVSGVWSCDVVYIWFLGRHAVLPLLLARALGRAVILVAGGWDVASCPEIDYGLLRPGLRALLARLLFKVPNKVLSVSHSNRQEATVNAGVEEDRSVWVPLGFRDFSKRPVAAKERLVVTIGDVTSSNLKRKGLEDFILVAGRLPDVTFVLVGRWVDGAIDRLKTMAPANVRFSGFLPGDAVDELLEKAAVYAQLSRHEAFGSAVAEAMLHRCVPVVASVFALPEVVGDTGYTVPSGDIEGCAEAVRAALEDTVAGDRARTRILELFPLETRRRMLIEVVRGACASF